MTPAPRFSTFRLPDGLKSRIEVATALAWEALVDTHVLQSLHFIQLLADRMPIEDSLPRYLLEMDLGESMASAVRTRVLASGDHQATVHQTNPPIALRPDQSDAFNTPDDDDAGWRRFRPDIALRELRHRARRDTETENLVRLALARAEESVIATHVDSAITFAALLDDVLPLARAVQEYIDAVGLSGGRAQAVHQRTMARLADVHLPLPPPGRD
ncbi:MAG: hypothetical protein ACREL7_05950 [Longimicrobiales bacterium]